MFTAGELAGQAAVQRLTPEEQEVEDCCGHSKANKAAAAVATAATPAATAAPSSTTTATATAEDGDSVEAEARGVLEITGEEEKERSLGVVLESRGLIGGGEVGGGSGAGAGAGGGAGGYEWVRPRKEGGVPMPIVSATSAVSDMDVGEGSGGGEGGHDVGELPIASQEEDASSVIMTDAAEGEPVGQGTRVADGRGETGGQDTMVVEEIGPETRDTLSATGEPLAEERKQQELVSATAAAADDDDDDDDDGRTVINFTDDDEEEEGPAELATPSSPREPAATTEHVSPPPPSPPASASSSPLDQLLAMGFPKEAAAEALAASGGSVPDAAYRLLTPAVMSTSDTARVAVDGGGGGGGAGRRGVGGEEQVRLSRDVRLQRAADRIAAHGDRARAFQV